MKPIKEAYPTVDDECPSFYDYTPLLTTFGYEILLKVDDNDYQGDSRLLFKNGDRFGLLIFGWGSCSGCDALQACGSFNEVEVLRAQLHEQIKWFESTAEARNYFLTHDWAGDYHGNSEETVRFIAQAMPLFA